MAAKKRNFGFKTPVRRSLKNVSGNKVIGDLTGGECRIDSMFALEINGHKSFSFELESLDATPLFNSNQGVAAIGGYFIADGPCKITLRIVFNGLQTESIYKLEADHFIALGNDYDFEVDKDFGKVKFILELETSENTRIQYTHFAYGFIDKPEFISSDEAHKHYWNSKRKICFPEQFYFDSSIKLDESAVGSPTITKSCNRCQRFLPINPFNQRLQLAFSNHCTTKAPCTHKNFSSYTIKSTEIDEKGIDYNLKNNWDANYSLKDGNIVSHYGHQLECKACKKFFVNAALNHLRSSTQHREDSLRRRAIELMVRHLLNLDWVYHAFRLRTGKEFDKTIWEKFNKKCFKCDEPLATPNDMDLDHTMPLSQFYPLDESATCLCSECNSEKSDIFPVDYYTKSELLELSKITGLDLKLLESNKPNQVVIDALEKEVVWFFDVFLKHPDYTKVRDGKRSADSILHSVKKVIANSDKPFDINKKYDDLV